MDDRRQAALAAFDRLLRKRPDNVGHDFSETTRCLAAYRDELIAVWRTTLAEDDRQRMAAVNAVLSVVLGGHFPLGPVPWGLIEAGRAQLATLVGMP
jgi:hypothetical protein